jgi:hypoxanthine phosphoribosyltransferase
MKKGKQKKYSAMTIVRGQPILKVRWTKQLKLILTLIRLILAKGYKPDFIICLATGGLFGAIIARALGVPYGVWMSQGYEDKKRGVGGKRRKKIYFADQIAFIDHRPKAARKRNPWPWKRVLIIDDLDDSGYTLHKALRLLREWYGEEFEIKTAALWHKSSSFFYVDFVAEVIQEEKTTNKWPWIDQPHEQVIRFLQKQIEPWR